MTEDFDYRARLSPQRKGRGRMPLKDLYKKAERAFNSHDVDASVDLFAPDGVIYAPNSPEPIKGAVAIRKDFENWFQAFPDVKIKFVNILSEGDTVAVQVEMTGTNTGPLVGPMGTLPPTNKRINMRGAGFARVNAQDQFIEERRYFDTAGMMAQLGITPGS